jgi:transposase
MAVKTLGVDVAKNLFQLHGEDGHGRVVLKRRLRRDQLGAFVAQLPACVIGLEACAGAFHWARQFERLGHTVRVISPQFVKPFVRGNKNDGNDAAAICEAVQRPSMAERAALDRAAQVDRAAGRAVAPPRPAASAS